jgi:hypothetical protein
MHEALVSFGVNELGLCPPLYVFTDKVDDRMRTIKDRYFSMKGQRCETVDPNVSPDEKTDAVITLIRSELIRMRREDTEAAVA